MVSPQLILFCRAHVYEFFDPVMYGSFRVYFEVFTRLHRKRMKIKVQIREIFPLALLHDVKQRL